MRDEDSILVLSYNIHKGTGRTGLKPALDGVRDAIRELGPDIVFLQEVVGSQGQLEHLAEGLWPHMSYGQNAPHASGHHGNAILSRFPILKWENVPLTRSRFESRGLLHATLATPAGPLHAFCTHFGLLESDRRKQARLLRERIEEHALPGERVILCGDFNDWRVNLGPFDRIGLQEAFLATEGSHARTFPSWLPALRLDRIYFRGFSALQTERHSEAPWASLSDHVAISALLKAS